jgi:uncharacterized protein with FMN-binding domain
MVPPQESPKVRIPPVHPEKKGRRRFSGSLLALSAAAITSIYTIGYVSTQASVDKLAGDAGAAVATAAPTQPAQRTAATNASPPTLTPATVPASPTAVPGAARAAPTSTALPSSTAVPSSPVPSPTASPTRSSGYKDGTYVAVGGSRHGSIEVTVVIQNGKIVSAAVSNCGTRYPCSDVAPLVKSVVSQQAVPVNHVSGATDSSGAYNTAVSKALAQAKQG